MATLKAEFVETHSFAAQLASTIEPQSDRFDPLQVTDNVAMATALLSQLQALFAEAQSIEHELAIQAAEGKFRDELLKLDDVIAAAEAKHSGITEDVLMLLEQREAAEQQLREEIDSLVAAPNNKNSLSARHETLVAIATFPMQECLERLMAIEIGSHQIYGFEHPLSYEAGNVDIEALTVWLNQQVYRIRLAMRGERSHDITFSLMQPFRKDDDGKVTYIMGQMGKSDFTWEELFGNDLIPANVYADQDNAPSFIGFKFRFPTQYLLDFGLHKAGFPTDRVRLEAIGFALDLGPDADDVRARLAFYLPEQEGQNGPHVPGTRGIELSDIRTHLLPIHLHSDATIRNTSLEGDCVLQIRRQVVRSRLNHAPEFSLLGGGLAVRDILVKARLVSHFRI